MQYLIKICSCAIYFILYNTIKKNLQHSMQGNKIVCGLSKQQLALIIYSTIQFNPYKRTNYIVLL